MGALVKVDGKEYRVADYLGQGGLAEAHQVFEQEDGVDIGEALVLKTGFQDDQMEHIADAFQERIKASADGIGPGLVAEARACDQEKKATVTTYVEGESMADVEGLDTEEGMREFKAKLMAAVNTTQDLAENGYVHGDLTPKHVLFQDDWKSTERATLFDLDSSSNFRSERGGIYSKGGSNYGPMTPLYADPEVFLYGYAGMGAKTDLYSLFMVAAKKLGITKKERSDDSFSARQAILNGDSLLCSTDTKELLKMFPKQVREAVHGIIEATVFTAVRFPALRLDHDSVKEELTKKR